MSAPPGQGPAAPGAGEARPPAGPPADGTRLVVVEDASALQRRAVAWLLEVVDHLLRTGAAAHLALPGGSTPAPVYADLARRLADGEADWSAVTLWLGDERCVPPDDPASNGALLLRTLGSLRAQGLPGPDLVLPQGAHQDPEAAAAAYAARLPRPLDLLVLGLGADGHTASLFPGSPALDEQARAVVAVEDGPPPLRRRLTVTPPVIAAARRRLVLAAGADKARAVAAALQGTTPVRDCPARLARSATWILDRAAAAQLAPPPTAPPLPGEEP